MRGREFHTEATARPGTHTTPVVELHRRRHAAHREGVLVHHHAIPIFEKVRTTAATYRGLPQLLRQPPAELEAHLQAGTHHHTHTARRERHQGHVGPGHPRDLAVGLRRGRRRGRARNTRPRSHTPTARAPTAAPTAPEPEPVIEPVLSAEPASPGTQQQASEPEPVIEPALPVAKPVSPGAQQHDPEPEPDFEPALPAAPTAGESEPVTEPTPARVRL